MKSFRVTVNGQAYDVSVEEYGTAAPANQTPAAPVVKQAPVSAPKPVAAAPAPAPAAPKAAPAAPKPAAAAGGNTVTAPMPGVVLNIMVSVGQTIKANDVLLILEAMKMENEVTAPVAGTVKEVIVAKGASVNTGDVMVVIE
jgi:glutaconyl-CoA decarboxylase